LQITATDSGGSALTYSAAGLPPGLSIGSSSGLISGSPSTKGHYNVTVMATDSSGVSGSTAFSWKVTGAGGGIGTGTSTGTSAQTLRDNPQPASLTAMAFRSRRLFALR
jgi:hypothetical protein